MANLYSEIIISNRCIPNNLKMPVYDSLTIESHNLLYYTTWFARCLIYIYSIYVPCLKAYRASDESSNCTSSIQQQ